MKNLGALLLGIWLILFGLKHAVGLSFHYDYLVLGILAIVTGVVLILRR